MKTFGNELLLNHITGGECIPPFRKDFEDYKDMVFLFLNYKGKYTFEEELVGRYSKENVTLKDFLEKNRSRFYAGPKREKNGEWQQTWYDLWSMEEVTHDDDFFDFFFTCKLRHVNLFDIDEYLSFHLDYSFKHQQKEYFRFLQLVLRQYGDSKLNPHIIETVSEWIKATEADNDKDEPTLSGVDKKIKGRMSRVAGDHLTCLNQVQTAMLIEYMQQTEMILSDHYLNDKQAGTAFGLLTGYSPDSLRLRLGKKGAVENVAKISTLR